MKNICLLDLNYTLVGNQADTRMLRPFSRRMEAEEYRADLIEAIRDDYVIIVTARPDYQMKQTMANIKREDRLAAPGVVLQRHQRGASGLQGERPPALHPAPARRTEWPGGGALLRGGEQSEDAGHVCAVRYRGRPL